VGEGAILPAAQQLARDANDLIEGKDMKAILSVGKTSAPRLLLLVAFSQLATWRPNLGNAVKL
jgi:hypothetical protein